MRTDTVTFYGRDPGSGVPDSEEAALKTNYKKVAGPVPRAEFDTMLDIFLFMQAVTGVAPGDMLHIDMPSIGRAASFVLLPLKFYEQYFNKSSVKKIYQVVEADYVMIMLKVQIFVSSKKQ